MRIGAGAIAFLFALSISVLISSPEVSALTLLSNCTTLNNASEAYQLTQNVSSTGTCFTISANGIILDLKGFAIKFGNTSDSSSGVYIFQYNNTVIRNGAITHAGYNTNPRGIYIAGVAINNTADNLTIVVNSSNSGGYGIKLEDFLSNAPSNNTIKNTNITALSINSSSYGNAIYLRPNASYNQIINVTGISYVVQALVIQSGVGNIVQNSNFSSAAHFGIELSSAIDTQVLNSIISTGETYYTTAGLSLHGAQGSIIRNNNITGVYGLTMRESSSSSFENNTFNTNQSYSNAAGIRLQFNNFDNNFSNNIIYGAYTAIRIGESGSLGGNNTNTRFTNDILIPCNLQCPSPDYDVYTQGGNEGPHLNTVLLNVSFRNKSMIGWGSTNSNITIQWYVRVNVTNRTDSSAISGANVNITNSSAAIAEANLTSASSGLTPYAIVTEFIGNNTANLSFTPHIFTANKAGFVTRQINSSITSTTTLAISLSDNYDYNLHNVTVIVTGVSGKPSSAVNISAYNNSAGSWNFVASQLTNSTGGTVFVNLPSENYFFNASRGGGVLASNNTAINGTQPVLLMQFAGFVSGAIRGINMTPLAPSNTSGGTFTFTVAGVDSDGNLNDTGGFNWTSSSAFVSAYQSGNGSTTGVFNATLTGTATIAVISNANTSVTNTTTVTVTPSTVASVQAHFYSVSAAAGANIVGNFTAKDRFGNLVPETFNYSSSDSSGTMPANGTANNTNATFVLRASGSKTITVSALTNGSASNTTTFTIIPGTPAYITFFQVPPSAIAGTNFTVNLTVTDAFGNLANSLFSFGSSDLQSALPTNGSVPNGTGVGSFQLRTAGTKTITAFSASNASAVNVSASITISPAGVATVQNFFSSTSATAGTQFTGNFTSKDAFGNPVPDTYNYSSSDSSATLPTNGTANNTNANFTLAAAGSKTIAVTSGSNASSTNATTFTVSSGNVASVQYYLSATSAVAGINITVNFTSKDKFGNLAGDTYNLSSDDAQAVMPSNGSANNTNLGIQLRTAGTATLNFLSASNSSATNSTTILVNASTVSQVRLTPQAPTVTLGGTQQFAVTIKDAFGNTNYTVNATYNVTALTGNGTINATTGLFTSTATGIITASANYSTVWNSTNITISAAPTPTPTPAPSSSITGGNVGPSGASSPTPTSAAPPSPTPVIPDVPKTIITDEHSSVTGTFSSDSSSFTLSYSAGASGFAGMLAYTLPLSYKDYLGGLIEILPKPSRVKEGSLVAEWEVDLKPNELFKAKVEVKKFVDPGVLSNFKAPAAKPRTTSTPPAFPSVTASAIPSLPVSTPQTAGRDNAFIFIAIGVLVLVGLYFALVQKHAGRRKGL
ncbi:MAG: right-handed parallel beta-helix repeat-containing protein [Candidatus Micrarchaeota archaeon]